MGKGGAFVLHRGGGGGFGQGGAFALPRKTRGGPLSGGAYVLHSGGIKLASQFLWTRKNAHVLK